MRQRFTKILLLAIAFGLMAAPCAFADNVYATIRGTVSDPTGAVVGKVQVTATNTDTHISKTAASLDDGSYELHRHREPGSGPAHQAGSRQRQRDG